MNFEFSSEARHILVYSFDYVTREYIGSHVAHVAPHTGLPGNSTLMEPPACEDGKVAVYNIEIGAWFVVDDFRGENVWSKETREMFVVDELGDIPDRFTRVKPGSDFDVWDGYSWVKDVEKERRFYIDKAENEKEILMTYAEKRISLLSRAVKLEIATEEEISLLSEWEAYTVHLSRIDTSNAPDIILPETPE